MKIIISESQLKTIVNEQDSWAAAFTDEYFKRLNKAKQTLDNNWGYNVLNKAIDWWNKWTMDKNIVNMYSKNWKISTNETLKIMNQYREALKGIKIRYVKLPFDNAIAFVKKNEPKVVNVNIENIKGHDAYLTYLHELQHLLFYIKPLHPVEKINDDLKINPNQPLSVFGNFINAAKNIGINFAPYNKINSYYSSKFAELGLTPYMSEYYTKKIKQFYSFKDDYIADSNEVISRLETVREMLHKPYGGKITPKEIGALNNKYTPSGSDDLLIKALGNENASEPSVDPNIVWMTLSLLFSPEKMSDVLNKQSSYVKADTNTPPSNQQADSIAS
jgi:hypothetical protein